MEKLTSSDIKLLLSKRFCEPSHAFFTEVGNGTGINASRYADAVSYSLFPSAGLEMCGYEIKVSRSDFLNEMKSPEKAEAIMQFCDKWYLVCPKGMVKLEEVPRTWGLYEVAGDRLYKRKPAPFLSSKPITREMLAALLRRATEGTVPRSIFDAKIEDRARLARLEVEEKYAKQDKKDEGYYEKLYGDLKNTLSEFEKASGLQIDKYNGGDIGEAVGVVRNCIRYVPWNFEKIISCAESLKNQATVLQNIFNPNPTPIE